MNVGSDIVNLEGVSDVAIFAEAALRLKQLYRREHGINLCFGSFEFVFEDGRFDGIDECQRSIIYQAPRRLTLVPTP